MPATTSDIFSVLADCAAFAVERHEHYSATFGILRRSLRSIIVSLRDSGDPDGTEFADRIRCLLSEWLTVPVLFDASVAAKLESLSSPQALGARWGRDIQSEYEDALARARELPQNENPVRTTLRTLFREMEAANQKFKIYCHRSTRPHFETIQNFESGFALRADHFLHSISEYRDSEIFDTLVKVGPLRSWGWGSVPDAIKSAPRFRRLVQLVWAGCADELGFGYDPVSSQAVVSVGEAAQVASEEALVSRIPWTQRITRAGQPEGLSVSVPPTKMNSGYLVGRLPQKPSVAPF